MYCFGKRLKKWLIVPLVWAGYKAQQPAAKPTVSSQKRSRSDLLCCLESVISQRPPRLFLSSSHMGSIPSCSRGSNCQYTSQTIAPKLQNSLFIKKKKRKKRRFQYDFNIACKKYIFSSSSIILAEILNIWLGVTAGILNRDQELNKYQGTIKYLVNQFFSARLHILCLRIEILIAVFVRKLHSLRFSKVKCEKLEKVLMI